MSRWWRRGVPVRVSRAAVVGAVVVVLAGAALAASGSSRGSAGISPAAAITTSTTTPVAEAAEASVAGVAEAMSLTAVRTVGLVGDSLLFEANADIERELADASLRVIASPGRRVHQLHDEATDLADEVDVLVLVLGMNNVVDGWGDIDTREVEALLVDTAAVPCRRWVTITDTAGIAHHDVGAARANAVLLDMAARHPGLELVPWSGAIAANPHYLDADQVHHSVEGRAALARAIAAAVRSCP